MAQGNQERHQNEPQAPHRITQDEVNVVLGNSGYRIHEGFAWDRDAEGASYPIIAPTSLTGLIRGYAEAVRNRAVANRNGVSAEAASQGFANGTLMPGSKSKDAFDGAYEDYITNLLAKAKNWAPLPKRNLTDAQKVELAERTKLIDLYAFSGRAAAKNHEKYYDIAVRESILAGKVAGTKTETKRKPATIGESEEL